jgi:hypothetical protein
MVIYDHWSNMTRLGILELVFIDLREGIQIDRLLFEGSRAERANSVRKYSINCVLSSGGTRVGFRFR